MSDMMNIPEDGGINTQEIAPEELQPTPERDESPRHGEALGMAMPAPVVKVNVTQARAGQALRRAWRAFAFKPVDHIAFYLVFLTANMVLPFLGIVYRLEALLAGMGRLAKEKSPAYGDVILPTKAREAYRVGGTDDHVHIACSLPRTLAVSKLLEEIKKSSSAWAKGRGAGYGGFTWQAGYGAFSLGQSQISALLRYIDGQAEHHRTQTFKEEFVAFLSRYGVDYDEEYLWD